MLHILLKQAFRNSQLLLGTWLPDGALHIGPTICRQNLFMGDNTKDSADNFMA